jgi:hypothetical protein
VALKVFLDGAGKEEANPIITVGGFLADSAVCEEMEREWEVVTKGHVFHLTDFGTKSCKLGSRDWTKEERSNFLKKLAAIVNRPQCYIISASLEVEAFDKVLLGATHPQELGPASSACAYAAVLNIEGLLKNENRQRQEVNYVFEKGDRENEIIKVFKEWNAHNSEFRNLRSHAFLPKKTTLLQPADLVAGVVQRCALAAFNAYPTVGLDNGLARTRLNTFDLFYSQDGVTNAVVTGHDTTKCWVVNARSFNFLDQIGKNFFDKHPDKLKKSMKQNPYKPKVTNENKP